MHILVRMAIKSDDIKKITIFFRVNIEDSALDGYSGEVIQNKIKLYFYIKLRISKSIFIILHA